MRFVIFLTVLYASLCFTVKAQPPQLQCQSTLSHHAVRIEGTDGQLPFVVGDQNFYQALDNGWVFALTRAELGWSIRLYERDPVGDAVDLTSLTPPLRGAPNPRDIFGWHFRNAANTAPNEGDVNAPQELRTFVLSPVLIGTGGLKPSGTSLPTPSPDDGIGQLQIVDYGLANPKPGTKARMNYLRFDACLSWPRSQEERDHALDAASLEFTEDDIEVYGKCGLDLDQYTLAAPFAPRQLSGDFDGDDAHDVLTRIKRNSDSKLGLAVCRAGTWLEILGFENFQDLRSGFVDQMESWTVIEANDETPSQLVGFDLPHTDGSMVLLERVEKEAILLSRQNNKWQAKKLYGHVEP